MAMPIRPGGRHDQPALLRALYGPDALCRLYDVLLRLGERTDRPAELAQRLIQPGDPKEYVRLLRHDTLCYLHDTMPPVGSPLLSLENRTTQAEVRTGGHVGRLFLKQRAPQPTHTAPAHGATCPPFGPSW